MSFLLNGFRDLFGQTDEHTKDKLGAYPERIHVRALPERRYLKTARILTIATLMSLLLNIALAFIIMYLSPRMTTSIFEDGRSQIFQADKFFKEVKTVPASSATVSPSRLVVDAELARYVRELFTVLPNKDEMNHVWDSSNFLALANSTDRSAFIARKQETFNLLERGVNAEVWIQTIHYSRITGLYEIIFDVYFLNNADALKRVCPCTFQNEACATCLQAEAFDVQRYKITIHPSFKSIRYIANPFGIDVGDWKLFRLPIYDPKKPEEKVEAEWMDVRLAR